MTGKYIYLILLLYFGVSNFINKEVRNNFNDDIHAQIDLVVFKQSGEMKIAKNLDWINKGEKFQLMIKANKDVKLLIINNSAGNCNYLTNSFLNANHEYIFPNQNKYFMFDGNESEEEIFVLIYEKLENNDLNILGPKYECKQKIDKLNDIFNKNLKVESKTVPPLLKLSGNVRTSEYSQELIAKDFILKKYSFNVQN